MPSNLNDYDIAPGMTKGPGERNGITEMTFPILRFEIHSLIFGLIQIKKKWAGFDQVAGRLQEEQNEWLASTRRRLEHDYMRHLDTSRPYDWLCSQFMEGMLVSAQVSFLQSIRTKSIPDQSSANGRFPLWNRTFENNANAGADVPSPGFR